MERRLAESWWAIALRGLVAVVFGILVFVWPLLSLEVLVLLFGAFALVDGVLALVAAFRVTRERWALLLEGVVSLVAGLFALVLPGAATVAFLFLIAAWSIVTGVFEIVQAIRVRERIDNEWWLILAGVASVLFGVLIYVWPAAGALAVAWIVGVYALLFGLLLLALAWRLRNVRQEGTPTTAAA
jgi:uncharacterized membrane protein HdeD (DUF308 family)